MLARCDELREETGGYFDARYESLTRVDPSGLVKGWSVDRGGELLERARHPQLLDQRRRRHPHARRGAARAPRGAPGSSTRVQLDRIAAVVEANDLALATSGTYIRGEHIVDPHTARPPSGLLSVTIAGRRPRDGRCLRHGGVRDGRGRGRAGRRRSIRYEALSLLADGTSLSTPGFPLAPDQ